MGIVHRSHTHLIPVVMEIPMGISVPAVALHIFWSYIDTRQPRRLSVATSRRPPIQKT